MGLAWALFMASVVYGSQQAHVDGRDEAKGVRDKPTQSQQITYSLILIQPSRRINGFSQQVNIWP